MKEEKYQQALFDLPAPGNGCHTAILGVANLGARAGHTADQIFWDIKNHIKPGNRRVPDNEIKKTVAKAVVEVNQDNGYSPHIGWDDPIPVTESKVKVLDPRYVEAISIPQAQDKPSIQIIKYLHALFKDNEYVSWCFNGYQPEGSNKWIPANAGLSLFTAGYLCSQLEEHLDDLGWVFGDPNPECGAWIRINPVKRNDNSGKDTAVSEYRHVLVECDNMELEKQYTLIRQLQLPCAALVHSGAKSIHAVIKIQATTLKEYQQRVDYLHSVCIANGLDLDKANVNPSRYSRFPGVPRGKNVQYLIATNCGQPDWEHWVDFIASANDTLPDIQDFDSSADRPKLAPEIIEGVLRRGHKMLLAGPSKAGKSFLLLELAVAIAQGETWLGWKCTQGKVLYINLELDSASCLNRIYDLLNGEQIPKGQLDVWNLRGHALPLSELAPKLIRRTKDKHYLAIIIDPIYKVITGDENAADQMAKFCNFFDQIATQLRCAVIYCHHHSKGEQGQKIAQDRASGSGVFARDPDAMLDVIEISIDEDQQRQFANIAITDYLHKLLDKEKPDWRSYVAKENQNKTDELIQLAANFREQKDLQSEIERISKSYELVTAWRIEGILREFPTFDAKRCLFVFPKHILDNQGILKEALANGEVSSSNPHKNTAERAQSKKELRQNEIMMTYATLPKPVSAKTLAEATEIPIRTLYRLLKESQKLEVINGVIEEVEK